LVLTRRPEAVFLQQYHDRPGEMVRAKTSNVGRIAGQLHLTDRYRGRPQRRRHDLSRGWCVFHSAAMGWDRGARRRDWMGQLGGECVPRFYVCFFARKIPFGAGRGDAHPLPRLAVFWAKPDAVPTRQLRGGGSIHPVFGAVVVLARSSTVAASSRLRVMGGRARSWRFLPAPGGIPGNGRLVFLGLRDGLMMLLSFDGRARCLSFLCNG